MTTGYATNGQNTGAGCDVECISDGKTVFIAVHDIVAKKWSFGSLDDDGADLTGLAVTLASARSDYGIRSPGEEGYEIARSMFFKMEEFAADEQIIA